MQLVLVLGLFVGVAYCGVLAPVAQVAEPWAPPQYEYNYGVHDPHTGDVHEQQETRHGDAVQGSYSLVEPDGSRRVVHYSADDHNGFQAVVQREPAQHPVKAIAAPVVSYATPSLYHH